MPTIKERANTATGGPTPGPWRIGDAGQTIFGPPNGNPSPPMVAQRVRRADARLIAAAPKLLWALQSIATDPRWNASVMREIARLAMADAAELCPRCIGTGHNPNDPEPQCPECDGTGLAE